MLWDKTRTALRFPDWQTRLNEFFCVPIEVKAQLIVGRSSLP
jgi:hypothetical protein